MIRIRGTGGDPVDGLSGSPQAAQDVVAVDVDGHSNQEQKKTCITCKHEYLELILILRVSRKTGSDVIIKNMESAKHHRATLSERENDYESKPQRNHHKVNLRGK